MILAFKYVKELDVEGMVADGDQVLTDMSDNNIEINYPKMSYPNVICAMDKVGITFEPRYEISNNVTF